MSENASKRGKEKGKGTGEEPGGDSEYIIDETVTVSKEDPLKSWDLNYDPQDEETHIIRAIARSDGTRIQAYILPKEELEFIEGDENVWWEYRSSNKERLKVSTSVTHEDEDPFLHDGDYVLAIRATLNHSAPKEPKISVKYRRE